MAFNAIMAHMLRGLTLVSALWLIGLVAVTPCAGQNAKLQTATGGITISGANSPFSAGFGTVNGLGIGTPAAGLTKLAVSGGEFYYTPYTLVVSGAGAGSPALVKAFVSTPFTNSSSVLQLLSCPYPGPCNSYSAYTVLQASAVTVLPNQASNGNYTAYFGLFVGSTNGSITTPDSAQISFDVYNGSNMHLKSTQVLKLNNPSVTIQTAVQLQLATDTADSGLNINFNSPTVDPNYTTNFGTVNGLGIGAGAGLTVVNGQVSNGSLYTTPYYIEPAFSGFSSTSNTSITAAVSTNFAHSTILALYDSGTSNSGYSKLSSSPTTLTSSVTNGTNIRRYLGLYVSNANGTGTFTGIDSATLTYTITVH